ncbi:hypothetical protein ACVW1C_002840 [Bradyrhizobium sp. USDA 4011]
MHKPDISIAPEDPRQPDVRQLIDLSDAHMQALYPPDSNHLAPVETLADAATVFLVARRDGEVLGSIAFRLIAPGHAEMKRMFVRAGARGTGSAAACSTRWRTPRATGGSRASAWRPESGSRRRSGSIAPPVTRSARRSGTTRQIRSACS